MPKNCLVRNALGKAFGISLLLRSERIGGQIREMYCQQGIFSKAAFLESQLNE